VLYKSLKADVWTAAKPRGELSLHDVFDIPPYGSVSIMNVENGMVYTSVNHGKINVKQIIEVADEHSGSIASSVKKYIVESLTEEQTKMRNQFRMAGVTERESVARVESQKEYLSDILHIASDVMKGKAVPSYSDITMRRVDNNDGTFHFVITNLTDIPFAFNLLAVKGDKAFLCFDRVDEDDYNNVLPPEDRIDLFQYVFTYVEECRYVLIVSKADFNVQKVRSRLDKGAAPEIDLPSGTVFTVTE
jgi:hypothetical protein